MRVIVVDRSDAARAALLYALREAHAHSVELHVVHAWQSDFRTPYPTQTVEQLRAAGRQEAIDLINEMLAEAGSEQRWGNAQVHAPPIEGSPAEALRTVASKNEHAPVVVVPARQRKRQASRCRSTINRRRAITELTR